MDIFQNLRGPQVLDTFYYVCFSEVYSEKMCSDSDKMKGLGT